MLSKEYVAAKLRFKIEEWLQTLPTNLSNEVRKSYVLAGGAFASTFHEEEPNDYDIWFRDKTILVKLVNHYLHDLTGFNYNYVLNQDLHLRAYKEGFFDTSAFTPLLSKRVEMVLV